MQTNYSEDSIKTLDWKEHIRKRPGMYVGKLGEGSAQDDGIYVLIKEVIDNSVDEYMMGYGKKIDISIEDDHVKIRDYGRGVPLGKVYDVVSKMNTGAKYDSKVFKKSVGLNGVGIKAVNALSSYFRITSIRENQKKTAEFNQGEFQTEDIQNEANEPSGTEVSFIPDKSIFGEYKYISEHIESLLKNYVYLHAGLKIIFNDVEYFSENGLLDLLNDNMTSPGLYPIIHLKGEDVEVAFTHGNQYGEEYYAFVNGQLTAQGGTHLLAFREALVKTLREFYQKDYDISDIKTSIVAAISIKVEDPVFESQTKTKLGSKRMSPEGPTIRNYLMEFFSTTLDNFLHKNEDIANILQKKIQENEKERKAISGIKKLARQKTKKASLHNKKLKDCKIHYNSNNERRKESTIFITEGDSASGSITKSRDVNTQAVFSLKGKPLNTFSLTKKVVYENEEFNLLQAALNIENGIENLRYNNIVIATDADVDGMHIRLLLITFFLKFFPEIVRNKHLHLLQTPLFRVKNKKENRYCYDEEEKNQAVKELGKNAEITRFKGLGEISPDEFKYFIRSDMRLEPVLIRKEDSIKDMLEFYMGKNSSDRQRFIIDNLRLEAEELG